MTSQQELISRRAVLHEMIDEILQQNPQMLKHPDNKEIRSDFLREAVKLDDEKIVELLIELRADVNFENPLEFALKYGSMKCLKLLLKNGANLEGPQWLGESPVKAISLTVHIGNGEERLKTLFENGLDIKFCNKDGQNLLHLLAYNMDIVHHPDVIKLAGMLLDKGVPLDEPDNCGLTPMFVNCNRQLKELALFFIKRGAEVNVKGHVIPLCEAIYLKNESFIELLICNGADVNAKTDSYVWTPLHEACSTDWEPTISLLIRKGAKVNAVTKAPCACQYCSKTPFCHLTGKYGSRDQESIYVMVKEIAKQKSFSSSFVSEFDLDFIKKHSTLAEYFENCEEEFSRMENFKFYSSYSYACVLKMSRRIRKLAKLIVNEEFVENFKKNSSLFSLYNNDLEYIFNEAFRVKEESEVVCLRLSYIFGNILPTIVMRKLSESLVINDLPLE